MRDNNRMYNAKNPAQGPRKRVLCVCSAGILRSPTAAVILASEFGHNTRAAGISSGYALISVDEVLLEWADEIVVMQEIHRRELLAFFPQVFLNPERSVPILVLGISDSYDYMEEALQDLIRKAYAKEMEVIRIVEKLSKE